MKITKQMQKVAADILKELEIYMMTHNDPSDEIIQIYDKMFKKYELCNDPFTGMVCTSEEYCKNQLEYERQAMIERCGHCDGLG